MESHSEAAKIEELEELDLLELLECLLEESLYRHESKNVHID